MLGLVFHLALEGEVAGFGLHVLLWLSAESTVVLLTVGDRMEYGVPEGSRCSCFRKEARLV